MFQAAYMGMQPMVLYQTPGDKHVVAGTLFHVDGNNVIEAAVRKAVDKRVSYGV